MAQPRDYLKPRNQEMRDLLLHLPGPIRVLDSGRNLAWQNQVAERLPEGSEWLEQPTTWQGKKAFLLTPAVAATEPSPRLAELEEENERLRRHQRQTARRKKKAEVTAKQSDKAAADFEKREGKLRQQVFVLEVTKGLLEEDKRQLEGWVEELQSAKSHPEEPNLTALASEQSHLLKQTQARLAELAQEYEEYRRQSEEAESQRQLEEQLAAKVREFEELERAFEEEQRAFEAQKQDLALRLSEQEGEFQKLKETVQRPSEEVSIDRLEAAELRDLKEDLEEAKAALAESARREARLFEKIESVSELKAEQSKMLALLKGELNEIRDRERELKETLKLYGDFRPELEQARADAKSYRAELEELRTSTELLEAKLLVSRGELSEARSQTSAAPKELSLRTTGSGADTGSTTVKSQLEFAQNRLRETEKQLDEARVALKKAVSDSVSAKDTEKLAFQDTLTGLPNRHIVDRYLDFSHKQAKQTGRVFALFLIDLDGFRVLNDTFGRDWGDALLKAVGERLAGMRGNTHIFARHSQDRFLLLASDLERSGADKFVHDASRSLLDALTYPFDVKGETISITGSIGAALGPGSLEDPRDLFGQAEVALDTAKASGAGTHFLHNETLLRKAQRDSKYLSQMEQAVSRNEFQAVYQPIFNLNKGMVTGLELFLRWNHRDQRTLKPDEFLDVALRSGLIFQVTEVIWPQAFRALARWRKLRPGVTLSINLSDRELLNPKLIERTLAQLKAAGVEPSAVLFEVRDASRLRFSSIWWNLLVGLHEAGFGLCLDDYGSEATMFGTLAYQGFRQAKTTVQEKSAPICTRSPSAAKGVLYCAKRIQTRFDPKALKKAGFDLAQGTAVAPPIDAEQVDGVLS